MKTRTCFQALGWMKTYVHNSKDNIRRKLFLVILEIKFVIFFLQKIFLSGLLLFLSFMFLLFVLIASITLFLISFHCEKDGKIDFTKQKNGFSNLMKCGQMLAEIMAQSSSILKQI